MNLGEAYVKIRPDTSGFRRELSRGVNAAVRSVRANVTVGVRVDRTGLRREVTNAVRAAGTNQNVRVGAKLDSSGLRREVGRAVRTAGIGQDVRVGINVEGAGAGTSGLRTVARDADNAKSSLQSLGPALRDVAAGSLLVGSSLAFMSIPVLTHAVSGAIGVTGALTAGLLGLAASLGQVAGAAPAAAHGLLALGQGIGVAAAAMSGIGDAIKGFTADEKAAATASGGAARSATAAARQRRAAAQAVEDATRNVAEAERDAARQIISARRDVADAYEDAAEDVEEALRRVRNAEQDLADAQDDVRRAQERLTQARRDAREELEDLQISVEEAEISELRARQRLAEAQREQRDLEDALAASGIDSQRHRAEAALEVREAEVALRRALERRGDVEEELRELQHSGIEGSSRVVDAHENVADAMDRMGDAQESLRDAHRDYARAQEDGNERIAQAQERLALVQEDSARRIEDAHRQLARAMETAAERAEEMGAAGGAASSKFADAMSKLSPAAQAFVRELLSMREKVIALRDVAAEGLFPGVIAGLRAATPLFQTFTPIVDATARALGNLARRGGEMVGSGPWQRDFTTIGMTNVGIIRSLGDASLSLTSALRHLLVTAGPLAQHFADLVREGAGWLDKQLAIGRESGRLAAFFERTRATIHTLGRTLRDLGVGFFNVFRQGRPLGDWMLRTFEEAADRFRRFTESVRGQNALRQYFADAQPILGETFRLVGAVGRGLGEVFRSVMPALAPIIAAVRTEVVPALVDLFSKFDGEFASAVITLAGSIIRFFGIFHSSTPVIAAIVGAFSGFLSLVARLHEALGPVGDVIVGFLTAIAARNLIIGIGAIARGLGGIAEKIGLLGRVRGVSAIFDALGLSVARLRDSMAAGGVGGLAGSFVVAAGKLAFLTVALKTFSGWLQGTKLDVDQLARATGTDMVGDFDKAIDKMRKTDWTLDGLKSIFSKAHAENKVFNDVLRQSPEVAQRLVDALQASGRDVKGFQEKIDQARLAAEGISPPMSTAEQAVIGAGGAARDAATEFENLDSAIRQTIQSPFDLEEANLRLRSALESATEAAKQQGLSAVDLALQHAGVRDQAIQLADKELVLAGVTLDAKEGQDLYASSLRGTAQLIRAEGGPAMEHIARDLEVAAQRALDAGGQTQGFRAEIDRLPSGKEVHINVNLDQAYRALGNFLGYFVNTFIPNMERIFTVQPNIPSPSRPGGKTGGYVAHGAIKRFASGNLVPGTGSGDIVPAMLEPGEFVVRRSTVGRVGVDAMRALNEGRIDARWLRRLAEFQAGGIVRPQTSMATRAAPRGPTVIEEHHHYTTINRGSVISEYEHARNTERNIRRANRYRSH